MDIKTVISEGVEQIKDRIPAGYDSEHVTTQLLDNTTASTSDGGNWLTNFLEQGPPGWIIPTALGVIWIGAGIGDAFIGSTPCHLFLKDNGNTYVAWIAATLPAYFAYKGWKHHSDNKVISTVSVAAKTPVKTSPSVTTATATTEDGASPA